MYFFQKTKRGITYNLMENPSSLIIGDSLLWIWLNCFAEIYFVINATQ